MSLGYFDYPLPVNEPVHNYAPGSAERKALKQTLESLKSQSLDIPMYIGDREVRTGKTQPVRPPHELSHTLGHFHVGDESHVRAAIDAALAARQAWSEM